MGGFQKTLFTLAMFILVAQTARHVYVKWFAHRASVLDQYTKSITDVEIEKTETLEALLARYAPLRQKVVELDEQSRGLSEEEVRRFKEKHRDEYGTEAQVGLAIRDWEAKSREIRELRIFWGIGLVLLLLGAAIYCKGGAWFGMALIAPGFAEMIWWTSPSFCWGGCLLEYNRLLNNKLIFSIAALVLLALAWALLARFEKRNSAAAPGAGR